MIRFLHWIAHRPRRLRGAIRGRLGARAVFAAYPKLLTWDPGKDLKELLDLLSP
jgi:hypothetical protein